MSENPQTESDILHEDVSVFADGGFWAAVLVPLFFLCLIVAVSWEFAPRA